MNLDDLIREALAEDLPAGSDVTSDRFVPPEAKGRGWIEAREDAVVSGLEIAARVFRVVDSSLEIELLVKDGAHVTRLQRVMHVCGSAASILAAERTALNFLCRLSGIATTTEQFVNAVQPWGTKILGTRKTTPGLREIEVAAVRHGGGDVYRMDLSNAVLLKDNHLGILGGLNGVRERLEALRRANPRIADEILHGGKIEASSLADVEAAVEMGWPQILLDNFPPADVAAAMKKWGNRVFLEMSGGVNLSNVREYAATGVHALSVGGITHSARAADFSLEVEWRSA